MGQRVSVVPEGLLIDGEVVPLYSGSLHYWRHDRALWKSMLSDVRAMGFRTVCTYMPWNVHEISPGQFDFGQIDPQKDVATFLETCREVGLFVLARPGPHINAELPWFGFPERVVTNADLQALTLTGAPAALPIPSTPFVMPSYASEAFYAEVSVYFDALADVIKGRIHPHGPIVAFQADNEMALFFRFKCYDVDYHPESVDSYRNRLRVKYGDISALNQTYCHTPAYSSFDEVEPPRAFGAKQFKELPYYLDWAEYQEHYISHGITRVRGMMEASGLTGAPYFHNYVTASPQAPFRLAELEKQMDIAGVDAYPQPSQYAELKLGARYTATMSRLPFIPEFLSGVWGWNRPLSVAEQAFITQAAFMHGIRAINYYMIADRDRWMACPLTRTGGRRDDYFTLYADWNGCLERLNWEQLRLESDVLILTPRQYDQLRYVAVEANFPYEFLMATYAKLPKDMFMSEDSLGCRDVVQQRSDAWNEAFRAALDESGVPYGLGDCDISAPQLAQYQLVIAPFFEWIDEDLFQKLMDYVQTGGRLICGPRWPRWGTSGSPLADRFIEMEPPASTAYRVEFDMDNSIGSDVELWMEDADLWKERAASDTNTDKTKPIRLKPGQRPPFVRRLSLGEGEITLVAAVFPAVDELESGAGAYRTWSAWVAPMLAHAGVNPRWRCDNKSLDLSILAGGGKRIVCIANPTPDMQAGNLTLPGISAWQEIEVWTDASADKRSPEHADTNGQGASLAVRLAPWTIRILEVN